MLADQLKEIVAVDRGVIEERDGDVALGGFQQDSLLGGTDGHGNNGKEE